MFEDLENAILTDVTVDPDCSLIHFTFESTQKDSNVSSKTISLKAFKSQCANADNLAVFGAFSFALKQARSVNELQRKVDDLSEQLNKITRKPTAGAIFAEPMFDLEPGMQEYFCHKVVRAAKIEWISHSNEQQDIFFLGLTYPNSKRVKITVSAEFMKKHEPQPGGYIVHYQNGYLSYSPAQAFEQGYTAI